FGGVSRMPAQRKAPALLTNRSIRPNRSRALAAMPSIWSASRTSVGTGRARAPSASTSGATVEMEPGSVAVHSGLFAALPTSHPSAASPRAMARPMPRLAPVTTATRPLNDGIIPRPLRCRAAVRHDPLAGHERGTVGRQVGCGVADLAGLADAADRLGRFDP